MNIPTKSELYLEQMKQFPKSTIIDKKDLLKYHKDDKQTIKLIHNIFKRYPNAVASYLFTITLGIDANTIQNSIRTGLGNEYTILKNIQITKT